MDIDETTRPLLDREKDADTDFEVARRRPRQVSGYIGIVGAFVCGVLASCLFMLLCAPVSSPSSPLASSELDSAKLPACRPTDAGKIVAPKQNLWKNLDLEEAVALRAWLSHPDRGLNLTSSDTASDSDNFIHVVEAYPPSKADALAHLSGDNARVDRYARAVINHGQREVVIDYLVGPLPLGPHTTIRELNEIYSAPVPLNARTTFNFTRLGAMVVRFMTPIDDITRDLYNISVMDRSLTISAQMPVSYDGSWRRTWVQLKRNFPGSFLHSVDFYYLVDMSGTDESKHSILAYVTNGKLYRSTEDLRAAYERGELREQKNWDSTEWATRARRGKQRDLDDRAGPRSVLADGARFRVDKSQDYVTWMGWSLYLSFYRDMGLHLWDIRFRGDRVIYELSPQEAMAQYSGSDPHQASTVWLDRAFGMGGSVREVILGYDCPYHATLLNATVHDMGTTTRQNAICIYEREAERPLSRHTGRARNEMGAIKGYELVIRSISTVGNYDYMFDYVFQLDGTIEVRVSASGYLQGGAWDDDQAGYGHKLRPYSMGSLHDHVINYKVDFDVAGQQNSLMKVSMRQETRDDEWFGIDGWGPVTQSHIVREMVPEETVLDFPQNMEGAYVVTNEAEHNAWGNPRGYALHPGPLCRLANVNAKRTEKSVNWAKHHLAVTVRKDTEPSSSCMWNGNLPGAPPVNFDHFFNNESIAQEDLVLWVNLGTHHIPRAEDSPNTLTNVATSYILLVPWNFNDEDPSMESRNSVLLNAREGVFTVDEAVSQPQCAIPPAPQLQYRGLVAWHDDGTPYTPIEITQLRTHADAIHAFGM